MTEASRRANLVQFLEAEHSEEVVDNFLDSFHNADNKYEFLTTSNVKVTIDDQNYCKVTAFLRHHSLGFKTEQEEEQLKSAVYVLTQVLLFIQISRERFTKGCLTLLNDSLLKSISRCVFTATGDNATNNHEHNITLPDVDNKLKECLSIFNKFPSRYYEKKSASSTIQETGSAQKG